MTATPLLYSAAGVFVGLMVGFTGVGGGSLMTPMLMLLFGQPPAVAVGTDLLFSAATKTAATASFGYSKRIEWRIVGRLATGSLPGTLGIISWFWITRRTPELDDHLIARCVAIMLAVTAVGLLLQGRLQRFANRTETTLLPGFERFKLLLTVVAGLIVGAGVTLTSVGAGALGTVALFALYPRRLTPDRLVATDVAHALPVTLIAGMGHAALGHLNTPVLGWLLLGSVPGVLIASRLTMRLPAAFVRILIAVMLALASYKMLLR
jgi:uncharacterized membrane protein YfcA